MRNGALAWCRRSSRYRNSPNRAQRPAMPPWWPRGTRHTADSSATGGRSARPPAAPPRRSAHRLMVPPSQAPRGTSSPFARDLAERIVANELRGASDDAAVRGAAERLSERIPAGLSLWFGAFGARALVTRALATQQRGAPFFPTSNLPSSPEAGAFRRWVDEHGASQGAPITVDDVITVIARLTDLIARLIGDDLVANILERSAQDLTALDSASSQSTHAVPPSRNEAAADDARTVPDPASHASPPAGGASPMITKS